MKTFYTLSLLMVLATMPFTSLLAQTDVSKDLVKQGVVLNDAGKYDEAIAKYNEALKADPDNLTADYEMGFTLYTAGKGKDAIPFLEKIIASPNGNKYETCDLLGSIYDDNKDPDNAIKYYLMGINDNPRFEKTHFNLGITYLRQKKYAESEASEIEAIKLDQKHASSQRIYAIATYSDNKKIHSLLAWCSFLLLEPQSERSPQAFAYIRDILYKGIKPKDSKNVTITVSDKDMGTENFLLPMTVLAATLDKKNLSAVDSLTLQLTEVFKVAGEVKEGTNGDFYSNFYAKFFNKLALSGNMPAFVRYISLRVYKADDLAWLNINKKALDNLDLWIRSNERDITGK
jgi:tetratricopeptide (TPR) repeat protein